MLNYKIIEKREISNSDVDKIIKDKEDKRELSYREEKVRDYLKDSLKLNYSDFEKAKKELEELQIPRVEEKHIIKILDIMPKSGTELRAIVSHSGTVLVDENVTKILEVLKKYQK